MGYRDYPKRNTSNWSASNPLIMLVIINVLFFILLHFIKSIYNFSRLPETLFMQHVHDWFVIPGRAGQFLQRPWVLFTAMFTQMNLILMVSNMFWLWTFGYILQDLIGERRVFPLYLYSGLAAVVVFLFIFNESKINLFFASEPTIDGMLNFNGIQQKKHPDILQNDISRK